MNAESKSKEQHNSDDIRAGYQIAIQLAIYESRLSWHTTAVFVAFACLLVAGAVFPSFIGTVAPKIISLVGFAFSLIGLIASLMWWSMVSRSRKYYTYWFLSARELEKQMSENVKVIERGGVFSDGNKITVDEKELVFKAIERIRMKTNINMFYITFMILFVFLVGVNIIRVIKAF